MQLDQILERFHITQWGMNRWQARCPAHVDLRSSLSISDAEDRVLIKCQAMCKTEDVVEAAGLKMRDLFYDEREAQVQEPEAIYTYTDENGNYLYEIVRFPNKRIAARIESGWGIGDTRRVLYNLSDLVNRSYIENGVYVGENERQNIYVVEGEKDVHNLRDRGYLATCPPFGAGKWKASYVKYFLGADVVVVADRDPAGYAHAEEIRESLEGVARSVKVVQAISGKDVSDHLEAGFRVEDLEEINVRV